jgi:hypothetical protein
MLTPGKDYNYIAQCHHITPVENKTPYYFAIKIADEEFFTKEIDFRELKQGKSVSLDDSFALVKTHMDPSTFGVVKIDMVGVFDEDNPRPTKALICLADYKHLYDKIKKVERVKEIKKEINAKLKSYQNEVLLNLMAQSDEEAAALLNEYKELTGNAFQK